MHLMEQEQRQINELVAEVEAKNGGQVLVAVIGKAEARPKIRWKALAVGRRLPIFSSWQTSCCTRLGRICTVQHPMCSTSWVPAPLTRKPTAVLISQRLN
jgi:hypothetical protein